MAATVSTAIQLDQLHQVGNLELLARQVVEGFIVGLHKSPFHGFSVEFAEHRAYNKGESTRHIDWKLFGKTDKLFVKKYEEETNLRCQIVIDNSSSMYFPEGGKTPNKIRFSVYAAAAILTMLKKQRDAGGLSVFSNDIEKHLPAKSNNVHQKLIFSELEKMLAQNNLNKTSGAATALHTISESIHKRSLVIIFSDMFDNSEKSAELYAAMQHLRYNMHEVILFHVVDKKMELDFEFENRPYLFVDMETGEKAKLFPAEIKKKYLEKMNHFKDELKLKCAQYRIDYVEADIALGFNQVLLPYFMKRMKLN